MGSRGYRRLFRRARAEIRRRRREAMIGACNDVVAHLAKLIATSHEREMARRMWPGFHGLLDMREQWPAPLSSFYPDRDGNGNCVGTIGGRPRTNPLLRHAIETDPVRIENMRRLLGTGPKVVLNEHLPPSSFVVMTDAELLEFARRLWSGEIGRPTANVSRPRCR